MADLIDRQAAIDAINKALDRETLVNRFVRKVVVNVVKVLPPVHELPTIDPVKHGMWICFDGKYYCSECDEEQDRKTNYCSGCGARQDISADGVKNER